MATPDITVMTILRIPRHTTIVKIKVMAITTIVDKGTKTTIPMGIMGTATASNARMRIMKCGSNTGRSNISLVAYRHIGMGESSCIPTVRACIYSEFQGT